MDRFLLLSKLFALFIFVNVCLCQSIISQTRITTNRVHAYYPLINLYFTVTCDNKYRSDISAQNLIVKENGITTNVANVSCFEPRVREPFSIAIVVDRNPSMKIDTLSWFKEAKELGIAFVRKMNGNTDEAMIISSKNDVEINVPMTNDTLAILNGINSLKPDGRYNIWETIYEAVSQLGENANNFLRAILVFTDGKDSNNTINIDDLISYAISNKFRVYTIGVSKNINDVDLSHVAENTGGKYFSNPTLESINTIFEEVAYIEGDGFAECEMSYNTSHCADGINITVEITAKDLEDCTGEDTKSITFALPLDSINVYPIQIDNKITDGTKDIIVPINISKPFHRDFTPTSFDIQFDSSCIQFVGVDHVGTLLNNIPVSWQQISNGISITTQQSTFIDTSGTLLKLIFRTNQPRVERECSLTLTNWTFNPECFVASLQSGKITIVKEVNVEKLNEEKNFILGQNYPNPFTQQTSIQLPLLLGEGRGEVMFQIYDIFGREVLDLSKEVISQFASANLRSSLVIRDSQLPSQGIYFYRLTIGNQSQTKMMMLIK